MAAVTRGGGCYTASHGVVYRIWRSNDCVTKKTNSTAGMHGGWYTASYGGGTARHHMAVTRLGVIWRLHGARPATHALRLHGVVWRLHTAS